MKIIIASDLHGSSFYAKKLLQIKRVEGAEKLILLGDVYNHGPRNALSKDYAPMEVAELLNSITEELIVIKGNCDSAVDTMISNFDFIEDMCLMQNGKTLFLTHGHVYNKDSRPKQVYDAVIYGHFHTGFIEKIGNTVFANTGSISIPKNNTAHSYLLLEDGVLTLKDLDGNIIKSQTL